MLTDLNILKILNLNNPNSAKIPIIVDSQLLKTQTQLKAQNHPTMIHPPNIQKLSYLSF